jgi:methylglutaconyl-CoA hydratase
MRVFASTTQVGLPETRLGIIPGAGGTYRLPRLIGAGRARDLILTGRRVSGAEAYFLGLADRLVEVLPEEGEEGEEAQKELQKRANNEVLKEAIKLAADICNGGPVAIRSALKAVSWAKEEVENRMYERVVGTEDRNEALAAFREKRKPEFKGR